MDFVTNAGRAEASAIAARIRRALDDLDDAGSAAYALLVSRDALSPAAPQWRELSGLLTSWPYLGDLRRLQEALEAIAGAGEGDATEERPGDD